MASSRRLRTTLLGLSAALWASPGLAQTGGTGGTSGVGLVTSDFLPITLQRQDGDSWVDLAKTDAATYLNQARCQCATPVRILVQMLSASRSKLTSLTATGTNARLYVGNNCAQLNTAAIPNQPQCATSQLGSTLAGLSTLSANGSWAVETSVAQLFSAVGNCGQTLTSTIWLWIDSTGSGYPDSGISGSSAPNLGIKLDGTPPAAPARVTVEGGDQALKVSWTSPTETTDLAGYLVFCMRGDGLVVFDPGFFGNQYSTGQILCSAGTPTTAAATTLSSAAGETSAVEVGAPTFFQNLDPAYLCTGLVSPTQTSVRLSILQNGIPYTVGVAAVDTNGNASPIQSGFVQVPVPTINFYQAYRDAGGQSTGGYCSLAGRGARLGAISLLAGTGLAALIIFRRRRRARRALSRGLPCLLLALSINPAQAQVITHESDETSVDPSKEYRTPKGWAIELRFGPYRPDVDSEFSGSPGVTPYKTMFGGKRHLMSQLELDWQFFQTFGSLAAGVAIGYSTASAKAFIFDPGTNDCVRDSNDACVRSGDSTSLRIIPIAALLVYRWDVAAEHWKIPLVPYGKLGLNYTFWDITDGNGDVPHYGGGHGSGGTAGWQAAAGVSLLLDFLDPSAARSLDMETNINHSYVFFEWNRVDATGLGMKNKLHVGDSRWVLGLMFEF